MCRVMPKPKSILRGPAQTGRVQRRANRQSLHVAYPPDPLHGGQGHLQQRKTDCAVLYPQGHQRNYRGIMNNLSDQLIADLQRTKRADLSRLSMAWRCG